MDDGRVAVTLASSAAPKSGVGGTSREDFWTEQATSVLIDAWGERYLALGRGNLKRQHWKEVADVVNNSREMRGRSPKSDMQCKNRIDTVKKKYKLEKSRIASLGASWWSFFHKLHYLLGPTKTPTTHLSGDSKAHDAVLCGVTKSDSSKTEPLKSGDSTDTSSPKPAKKRRMNNPNSTATSNTKGKKKHDGGSGIVEKGGMRSSSIGEVTKAIMNLGDAYEQAESVKLRQVVEMEQQRMKFTKDLELQRMQLFMKTQLEITQMKEDAMSSYRNKNNNNNSHLHHQLHTNHNNNNNISNLNNVGT